MSSDKNLDNVDVYLVKIRFNLNIWDKFGKILIKKLKKSEKKGCIYLDHDALEWLFLQGGIPEIPGLPNPTFSQTVGSITTHPHNCEWCHKQYASKAKLLQHQRKKHYTLLPPVCLCFIG